MRPIVSLLPCAIVFAGVLLSALAAEAQVGSVCGLVVEESQTQVAEAQVQLLAAGSADPSKAASTDARGEFCFADLLEGSYTLTVSKKPWPDQLVRIVEVRADHTTRLKIELEYEPGEPRASFEESLDGLDPGERRAVVERLLAAGDSQSLHELARRLVPKRSVGIELGFLVRGLQTGKLVEEVLRYLERGYLPPLKTARFLHVLGELGDERVIPLLLNKLTDGRRLPPGNYVTWNGLYDPAQRYYVSDEALRALTKMSGRDFKYQLGKPPLSNQRAIDNAREWWRQEQAKKQERQRR